MLQTVIWRQETVARLQRLAKFKRSCESSDSITPSQSAQIISPCSPSQLQYSTPASHVHSTTAAATLPAQQEYCALLVFYNPHHLCVHRPISSL